MDRLFVELRAEVDGNRLAGHAAVFGQLARLPGHWERIADTAFDKALDESDPRALVNHDPSLVLGRRSAGTLRVGTDPDGLAFEVDLPDTGYARDLRALVARGDVTGASFGFLPGDDEWSPGPDGRQIRTHTSIRRLMDVSVVTFPAYDGAGVALRSAPFSNLAHYRSRLIRARHQTKGR